jgi:hypothetical protein
MVLSDNKLFTPATVWRSEPEIKGELSPEAGQDVYQDSLLQSITSLSALNLVAIER